MKKFILLILTLFLISCEEESKKLSEVTIIELSDEERESAGDDQTVIAQLLIKNAILNDGRKEVLTEDETKRLVSLKENIEKEFFIEKNAVKGLEVDPIEILKVYEDNKDKLKGAGLEEVAPQIKQLIINKKIQQRKIDYINGIIKKYDLNSKLKEYSGDKEGAINPKVESVESSRVESVENTGSPKVESAENTESSKAESIENIEDTEDTENQEEIQVLDVEENEN